MTRVFGLVDPDPERRRRVVDAVTQRLGSASELRNGRWESGNLTILNQVGATAPVDQAFEGACGAWVLGTVHGGEGQSAAAYVLQKLAAQGPTGINGLNGYYLACTVDASGAVALGTDAFGFFPLYFWANSDVLVFASDPGLVRLHPCCPDRMSMEGLAGILLQGHEANGQSIWEGVCRPDAGQVLRWVSGSGASTRLANPLLPSDACFGMDYASARRRFNDTLHETTARAVQNAGGPFGLMLSGGIDSRLLAGHVGAIAQKSVTAFTFGDPSDIEVQCAAGVAHRLRLPMVRVPMCFRSFPELAAERVAEEQLANSLWDLGWISGRDVIARHGLRMLNGFFGDAAVGGSTIGWSYDPRRGTYSFETLLAKITSWGFSPERVADLVPAESMARIVSNVVDRMRSRYDALPGLPFQKSWLWGLLNRNRYHVGAYPWRLSSAAWPLMPYLDRQMLELAAGMPLDFLGQRRIQIDTLKRDFLPLARLPLDRNAFDTTPLCPSRLYRLRARLLAPFAGLVRGQAETRSYYRIFDINNPGWRAVREFAEGYRLSAQRIFGAEALARWLPAPAATIACENSIIDTANRKTLLNLMIFAGQETEATLANPDH
jgi:asparagine synthase (glutamine-hydrolysing)